MSGQVPFVETGLDALQKNSNLLARWRDGRVGVLAHAASVDRHYRHIVNRLAEHGVRPTVLFGPEHGFVAAAQDMDSVDGGVDAATGARIVSLYGDSVEDLAPKAEDLADLDTLVIDLADIGSRYYTYVWTALIAARAAIEAGVATVILDRPNPIGGDKSSVEGRIGEPAFRSFVGWERVPVRHSLTLAEMVLLHLPIEAIGKSGSVSVVPTTGWRRSEYADSWDRDFVLPSPNMPTLDTAVVYPGGCLLEGTNLSEGRGHTRPFEIVGAPWLDSARLSNELNGSSLEGFVARPVYFTPTFHKHAGAVCGGVQIHVTDRAQFRPYATYLALIGYARQHDPERFRFRTERYEFIDHIPAIDLLTGSALVREGLERDEDPLEVALEAAKTNSDWAAQIDYAARLVEMSAVSV